MSDVFNIARMMLVLVATFFSLPLYTWLIANCAIYWIITITCVICVFFCSLCYSLSLTRATTNQFAYVQELIRCIPDRKQQRSVRGALQPQRPPCAVQSTGPEAGVAELAIERGVASGAVSREARLDQPS